MRSGEDLVIGHPSGGVYTAVEALSRRGFIDVVIETRGARKVRLYRVRTI